MNTNLIIHGVKIMQENQTYNAEGEDDRRKQDL